jgi:hypothetical protein
MTIAEAVDHGRITPDDILDLMAEARYNDSGCMIIHAEDLGTEFFDLKTGIAGEILQKFSNYRMRLSIVGDFSRVKSKSLKDFIRESNRTGIITFVSTLEEALLRLSKKG